MNPRDLLYTNTFTNKNVLSKDELHTEAMNAIPYSKIKEQSVNDVRTLLEDKPMQGNPLNTLKQKAQGWNQGDLANQRPFLSNFANDIASESYFDYVKTYVNIDSRMRDKKKSLKPNDYVIYLNKVFQNISSIKIIDYNFPNFLFPINEKNNTISFFIPLVECLSKFPINNLQTNNINDLNQINCSCCTTDSDPYEIIQGDMDQYSFFFCINNICSLLNKTNTNECVCNCNNSISNVECCKNTDETWVNVNKVLKKSIYSIKITPGMYSVNSLSTEIENEFNKYEFYNSNLLSNDNIIIDPPPCEYGMPLKMKVLINPETHIVKYLLRFEEFKINKITTTRGTNIMEIYLDDISNTDINVLDNNNTVPLILTDFPSVGGINNNNLNWIEFLPQKEYEIWKEIGINSDIYKNTIYSYYSINSKKKYIQISLYNKFGQPKNFSRTESIDKSTCGNICNSRIGRESPFSFILNMDSPLFNISNILDKSYDQQINNFSTDDICLLKNKLFNADGSSRSLIIYLGYLEEKQNNMIVGGLFSLRGINTNIDYQNYLLIDWLTNYGIYQTDHKNMDPCCLKSNNNGEIISVFQENFKKNNSPSKYLKIYLGNDGNYYFNNNDYILLKLVSLNNNTTQLGKYFLQGVSNSELYDGNEKLYKNPNNTFGSININFDINKNKNPDCSQKKFKEEYLVKNLNNIFAKFKISSIPGKNIDVSYSTKIEYFNEVITNLDSLLIQFISYDGEILDLNSDHDFVIEITEKLDVLKETNINSRTGYINKNI